jgi:hypothetical protein
MRFLGGKWRKKKVTAKAKAINQSLGPSGFAPAFGRAVAPFAAAVFPGLSPALNLKGKSKSNSRSSAFGEG